MRVVLVQTSRQDLIQYDILAFNKLHSITRLYEPPAAFKHALFCVSQPTE